jgi:hypothetical protein
MSSASWLGPRIIRKADKFAVKDSTGIGVCRADDSGLDGVSHSRNIAGHLLGRAPANAVL